MELVELVKLAEWLLSRSYDPSYEDVLLEALRIERLQRARAEARAGTVNYRGIVQLRMAAQELKWKRQKDASYNPGRLWALRKGVRP
jgi:hypothetical protein